MTSNCLAFDSVVCDVRDGGFNAWGKAADLKPGMWPAVQAVTRDGEPGVSATVHGGATLGKVGHIDQSARDGTYGLDIRPHGELRGLKWLAK